jgi:replicative DNA helicase
MDYEKALICKVLSEKSDTAAAEAGISPKYFLDPDNRKVWQTLIRHKTTYGKVPTVAAMMADHPDYKFIKIEDSLEYLIDKMRNQHVLSLVQDGLEVAVDAYDERDGAKATAALSKALAEIAIAIPNMKDVDLTETGEARIEKYRAIKNDPGGLRGIPSGFWTIDRATQGFQPEQLVTIIGPPKAGKSTLMLLCAMAAHAEGKHPLFIGFEMSNDEQAERLDAIKARVDHKKLRSGNLSLEEMQRLERSIHQFADMPPFHLSSDSLAATTLTGVAGKLDTIKPDILFVDGLYLMDDENGEAKGSSQALTNLTRGFKRLAQNRRIPVVISTQVLLWKLSKTKGVTAEAIGYSSSFAQDSDVILGAEQMPEMTNTQKLKVVLARNCPPMETLVTWDWATGTFAENQTPEDADNASY